MKKTISTILAIVIIFGNIPVFAKDSRGLQDLLKNLPWELEDVGTSEAIAPTQIADITLSSSADFNKEVLEYEPIVHEETVNDMFVFSGNDELKTVSENPEENGISLLSLENDESAAWKTTYGKLFGDDYLKPYERKVDGQKVSGNTNRLVIEETDLRLPGKNGLDVVIKRKHDNQDYNVVYSGYSSEQDVWFDVTQHRYVYAFTNVNTLETLYVAFLSEDQMYMYMYNGCNIGKLNEKRQKSYTNNAGVTIKYYDFEDISISDNILHDQYEYDSSVPKLQISEKYKESTTYKIAERQILDNRNFLGKYWKLMLPEAFIFLYNDELKTNNSNTQTTCVEEYVGAFRDINGNVYTFNGNGKYTRYKGGTTPSTYSSTYSPDSNKNLYFESMYAPMKFEDDGPEYNFVIYDSSGLTYYLYDKGVTYGSRPKSSHSLYIIAVKDDYGNKIKYEYDADYKITKIIDTYNREINFETLDDCKQISYYDDISEEIKTIKYTTEVLPSSCLDNDSVLKGKNVIRFTVTNQENEKIIYDSRETEVLNYYSDAKYDDLNDMQHVLGGEYVETTEGMNIERIIYPTGAETRYKYKCIYPINYYTKVRSGVYAVDASYDIVEGNVENQKEYSFENSKMNITNTCVNNSAGTKTVTEYDEKGMNILTNITPISENSPYKRITYKYDIYNNPINIVTDENGVINTVSYSYLSGYPNLLRTISDGRLKTEFEYHSKDIVYVGSSVTKTVTSCAPKRVTYFDMTSGNQINDYSVETELTDDKKSVEYERIIKNNIIKSQIKYEYDNEGQIIKVMQWTDDTNSDGVLDENDDIIMLSNEYIISEQKVKHVKNIMPNIINADEENEGDVVVEYSHNIFGSPLKRIDPYGEITTIEYDDINRIVQYNMPNGSKKKVEYNTAEKYALSIDEGGVVTKFQYDGLGRIAAKYVKKDDMYNKTEEYVYDVCGRVFSKTLYRSENEGVKETYSYDTLDRIIQKSVYDLPNELLYTENYTYSNSSSQLIVTKTVTAKGASAADVKNYYDRYGNLIKTESITDNATLKTEYEYDYRGRVIKQIDSKGNETTYEYAYDGQVLKQINANGSEISTIYDLAGQAVSVTDANGNTANTVYDKMGRVIKVITPFDERVNGETKTYYDKNSNVVKTAIKRSANIYQIEKYKYDNVGNVLAVISNDGVTDVVTQYEYNTSNRMVKMITGLSAYSENPEGGVVTEYSYDSQGNLAEILDPMRFVETYEYDFSGNLLQACDKNGVINTYEYGAFGLKKQSARNVEREYIYNKIGQMIRSISVNADGSKVTKENSYDGFGRLKTTRANDGSVQSYAYDANSNVTSYTLSKNGAVQNRVKYTYDSLNQLTSLTNNDIITTYSYDANGNLIQKVLDTGVISTYEYNKAGLLTYTQTGSEDEVYTYSRCSYLLNGLLQIVIMPFDGYADWGTKTKAYEYDNMGRLKRDYIAEEAGVPVNDQYYYDLRGNRVRMKSEKSDDFITETIEYQYDLNNHLVGENSDLYDEWNNKHSYSSTRYYYDNNGNMTARQKESNNSIEKNGVVFSGSSNDTGLSIYRYDEFNRLTNFYNGKTEASYTYYADNLRASKTINRQKISYAWDGMNLASETKDGVTNTYTYDITGVHIANQDGNVLSYVKDSRGNILGRSNLDGEMLETAGTRIDYDAFGNRWNGAVPDPFGYCGEYYDAELDMVYLRNRYYSPDIGRFITEDPIRDGLNWYAYCENDPINFRDVSGYAKSRKFGDTGQELLNYKKNSKTSIMTYIYGQGNKSVASLKLGSAKVKDVGCETIAIHNALVATYDPHEYSDVLYECETIKIANGILGCSPWQIGEILNAYDHLYAKTKDVKQLDSLLNTGRVFIMSFWNNDKWNERLNPVGDSSGLHTIAFRKNDDGSYTAWNVYSNQTSARIYETFDGLKKETYENDDNFIILYKLIEE